MAIKTNGFSRSYRVDTRTYSTRVVEPRVSRGIKLVRKEGTL